MLDKQRPVRKKIFTMDAYPSTYLYLVVTVKPFGVCRRKATVLPLPCLPVRLIITKNPFCVKSPPAHADGPLWML